VFSKQTFNLKMKKQNDKLSGESLNITQIQLEKLKSAFPEVVTDGKIDWEKLQATLGKDNIEFSNERYVLNWAGKSEAFKILQQTTTATLQPIKEESLNFENTENVFIEGENLEVLKILQKSYFEKIKCIIIDPPYNTGNDSFIYPDSFKESREDYEKRIGERDQEGYLMKEGYFRKNSKDNGHYHSNWLSMMYPRLFLAKNLLKEDGVIFVHIDDNEVHNLRMIMNEIFGEENFVAQIIRKTKSTTNDAKSGVNIQHEYCIAFSKHKEIISLTGDEKLYKNYSNPDDDPLGDWTTSDPTATDDGRKTKNISAIINPYTGKKDLPGIGRRWRFNVEGFSKLLEEKRIIFKKKHKENERGFILKRYKNELQTEYKLLDTLFIDNVFLNQAATKESYKIFEGKFFDYPKPVDLIHRLIDSVVANGDIVLDFFAGSGTSAHAVINLNKEAGSNIKFILVQLPELCENESEAFKAGYKTIADIGKERIRRVIKKIENEKTENPELIENDNLDLGFKVFKLSSSNFKIWRGSEINENNLESSLDIFTNPVKDGSETENMLYEIILKAGCTLTDKVEYIPFESYKNKQKIGYYSVNNGDLIIALDKINQEIVDKIISSKPQKVITLDNLFAGNDQLKTNTVLQMKDVEIDFKTI
jgi:adenine-specific DNA-methyltransferase